ncbi:MAG: hypothetical protein ACREET_10690, partial [Stellaceae bacterium]
TAAHRVVFVGGAGADVFSGGAGNDTFELRAANLGGADRLRGAGGSDRLVLTSAGTIANLGVFAGIETLVLSNAGKNTLVLGDGNFAGVTGKTITVLGGSAGNAVNASTLSAANRVVLVGGGGTDILRAGDGRDTLTALRHATMTGGAGGDLFELEMPGASANPDTNRIVDFHPAQGDELAFSNSGFGLGLARASAAPKALPARLFSARTNGIFDKPGERFAYDKSTGRLYFDGDGSGATDSRQLVATLSNHAAVTASDLFFVS